MGKPTQISDANFEQEVLKSDKPVLVDFWATWCGPCRMVGPVLEEIAAENETFKVVKLDIDANPITPGRFSVRAIPTMILFKGGEAADMKIGAGTPKAGISKWLESHAESHAA